MTLPSTQLWPSIWMLPVPVDNKTGTGAYGAWPRSCEINLVESRGNGIRYTRRCVSSLCPLSLPSAFRHFHSLLPSIPPSPRSPSPPSGTNYIRGAVHRCSTASARATRGELTGRRRSATSSARIRWSGRISGWFFHQFLRLEVRFCSI
ncbi:hypothetical protein B0H19DRAFT_1121900 [Mycena capillaripes]|nr:hypothetical protein B0H19DRAFT_1121900 [Mycena capillaripes]